MSAFVGFVFMGSHLETSHDPCVTNIDRLNNSPLIIIIIIITKTSIVPISLKRTKLIGAHSIGVGQSH